MSELPTRVATTGKRLYRYLRECFAIDPRSLALFRVALGSLIIADVISRSRNFSFYYTDDGVVPQELAEASTPEHAVSVFYYTSDPTLIAVLFGLHVLFAIQLIVGYKTRLAAIISFLFVISLDHHNPFVLSYADVLFRIMFFWAIFLPMGERWSIDAVHRDRSPRRTFVGLASMFAMGQLVFMYFLNGLHKHQSELWRSGEAAYLVMGLDEMTFLLGDFMRHFEIPLQVGGWLWFHMLLASPLLILLRGRKRLPLVVLFMGGHASFAITVRIGAFAFVALAALLLFLPREFWDDLESVLGRAGLGLGTYATLRTRLVSGAGVVPRLSIQTPTIRQVRSVSYTATMVVIAISIAFCAALVAPDITLLGETDIDDDYHPDERIEDHVVGTHIYTVAESLNVDQPEWSIFAGPDPRTTDRYYVFAAETEDGELLDVFNDRELTYDRPGQQLQKQHGAYRERFYMNTIRRTGQSEHARLLADHYCETYAEHGTDLKGIAFFEITEQVTRETVDDPDSRSRDATLRSRHLCDEGVDDIDITPPDF